MTMRRRMIMMMEQKTMTRRITGKD